MISIEEIESKLGHQLSNEQKQILEHEGSALSIVACAGSGKTTTIETKMIYDIINEKVDPSEILCVTFSKKSQLDMNEKYDKLYQDITGENYSNKPRFSTFHSLFKFLIDKYIKLNYAEVLTSHQYYYSQLMRELNYKSQSGMDLRIVLEEIFSYYGYNINTLTSFDGITNIETVPTDANFTINEYLKVIDKYKRLKSEDMFIDFEDMQLSLYNVLNSSKPLEQSMAQSIIEYFNDTYKNVYVDEFQDISTIQNSILDSLIDNHYDKLIVVGDDDQSIYKFRGSNPEFILNFANDVKDAKTLLLSTNYRCKEDILKYASNMIKSNCVRFDKSISAFNKGGYFEIISDNEMSSKILDIVNKDMSTKKDETFAILCRHNIQLALIADLMTEREIDAKLNNQDKYSLQNNYLYNDLINTVKALKYNDLDAFKQVAHKILLFMSKKNISMIIKKAKKDKMHWFDVVMYDNYWHKSNNLMIKQTIESMETLNGAKVLLDYAYDILYPYFIRLEEEKKSNQLSQLNLIKDHIFSILLQKSQITFDQFLENEEYKKNQLSLNEYIDEGLNLITFHSSKGLEFDNVYIINANHMVTPGSSRIGSILSRNSIEDIKLAYEMLEEERRLFYVACTRAKHKLVISHLSHKQSLFVDELTNKSNLTVIDAIKKLMVSEQLKEMMSSIILDANNEFTNESKNILSPYLNDRLHQQLTDSNIFSKDNLSYMGNNIQEILLQYNDNYNL